MDSQMPAANPTPPPATAPAIAPASNNNNRLPNGTVAGIVVGVAVAVAIVTFLVTFFAVRKKRTSASGRLHKEPKSDSGESSMTFQNPSMRQSKQEASPMSLDAPKDARSYEVHLPQPADDSALKKRTSTLMERIELHVENFYRKRAVDTVELAGAAVEQFNTLDSGKFSGSLASLAPRAKNILPIAKHTLAYMATSAISTSSQPRYSLLPNDLALIPRTVTLSNAPEKQKQVTQRCLSRWRVLTAYLRPDASKDAAYIAERDAIIKQLVSTFTTAFSPWKNTKYGDEQRAQSLAAVFEEVADLGIWFAGQPFDLRFRWAASGETGTREVVVTPGLAKVTDDQGKILSEPITLLRMAAQEI